jgi:hypothetical protein
MCVKFYSGRIYQPKKKRCCLRQTHTQYPYILIYKFIEFEKNKSTFQRQQKKNCSKTDIKISTFFP